MKRFKTTLHWVVYFLFSTIYPNHIYAQASSDKYNCIEVWKNGVHRVYYEAGIDSITINPTERLPIEYDPYNGHDYVDLGLPSGTKWATCNIGATSPTEIGWYVSWADMNEKPYYDWDNTNYFDKYWYRQTKYCKNAQYGKVDDLEELELVDDIAFNKWGENWRIPSKEDFEELIAFCSVEYDDDNQLFTVTGLNGNFIQFHITGFKYRNLTEAINPHNDEAAAVTMVWSRTLTKDLGDSADKACALSISESGQYEVGYFECSDVKRCYGCVIRPVSYYDEKKYEKDGYVKLWQNGKYVEFPIESPDSIVLKVVDDDYKLEHNGFEYTDLGLPSGVMWATQNVGAQTPVDKGLYFSWAEIEAKSSYKWSTYTKYGNGKDASSGLQFTKYTWKEGNGPIDDNVELLQEDDAAFYYMGKNWRTPSYFDFHELTRKSKKFLNLGKFGYSGGCGMVYVGPSGSSIFLPAAGYQYEGGTPWLNELCIYWMSHLWKSNVNASAYVDSGDESHHGSYPRYYGLPVRGVVDFMNIKYLYTPKEFSSTNVIKISTSKMQPKFFNFSQGLKITYSAGKITCSNENHQQKFSIEDNPQINFCEICPFIINDVVKLVDITRNSEEYNSFYDLNNNGHNEINDIYLMVDSIVSFSVNKTNNPNFEHSAAKNVTTFSAELNTNLNFNKISQIQDYGFLVGKEVSSLTKYSIPITGEKLSVKISNLDEDTYYYYIPYAETGGKTYYGDISSFATNKSKELSALTLGSDHLTPNNVTISGLLSDTGGNNIEEFGFYYGTTPNPQIKAKPSDMNSSGGFTITLNSLNENTTYYYTAFIKNSNGISFGEVKSFKTPAIPKFANLYLKGTKPIEEHPRTDKHGLWITIEANVKLSDVGEYDIKDAGFLINHQVGDGMVYNSSYSKTLVTVSAPLIKDTFSVKYNYYGNATGGVYIRPYIILKNDEIIYMNRHYVYDGLESNYTN